MLGLINMAKKKQLRARVEDDLYNRVESKTDKISDFVRDAVEEKLEREEYGNESTVAVDKKHLELLLESRKTIIAEYEKLIEKEETECKRIQAQIDEKNRILEAKVEREENIKNNPQFKEEFDNTVMFLLRKKYLQLDGNAETVFTNKAQKLGYNRTSEFKDDLKNHVRKEWMLGKKFKIENEIKDIVQQDLDYIINRL